MPTLQISDAFTETTDRLSKEGKVKLLKTFRLLAANPRHPSLQLKKMEGSTRDDIYECRVDLSLRLILQQAGDTLNLICVGRHDEALAQGTRVRDGEAPYAPSGSAMDRCRAFLAGEDGALIWNPLLSSQLHKS